MSKDVNLENQNDVIFKESILLPDIESIKKFVAFANEYDFPIILVSDKYIINGKSIMGIFGLDLSKPLELRVCSEVNDDFKEKVLEFKFEN